MIDKEWEDIFDGPPIPTDQARAELEALLREEAERQRENRKSLIRMQAEMFAKGAEARKGGGK